MANDDDGQFYYDEWQLPSHPLISRVDERLSCRHSWMRFAYVPGSAQRELDGMTEFCVACGARCSRNDRKRIEEYDATASFSSERPRQRRDGRRQQRSGEGAGR